MSIYKNIKKRIVGTSHSSINDLGERVVSNGEYKHNYGHSTDIKELKSERSHLKLELKRVNAELKAAKLRKKTEKSHKGGK